jgi:hypothetical protein
MTDLQFYLTYIAGFVLVFAAIFFAGMKIKIVFIRFLIALVAVKALINVFGFVAGRIDQTFLTTFLYSAYYAPNCFLSGAIVGFFMVKFAFPSRRKTLENLLSPYVENFDRVFRIFIATTFLPSFAAFINISASSHFFIISGYSVGFLIFIIALEGVCGLGVLFGKTAVYASALLICDMAGATYTHYHNYFTIHAPDPFSNSMPSLLLQPFLIIILVVGLHRIRRPGRVTTVASA